jgi:hypothetical protein
MVYIVDGIYEQYSFYRKSVDMPDLDGRAFDWFFPGNCSWALFADGDTGQHHR